MLDVLEAVLVRQCFVVDDSTFARFEPDLDLRRTVAALDPFDHASIDRRRNLSDASLETGPLMLTSVV